MQTIQVAPHLQNLYSAKRNRFIACNNVNNWSIDANNVKPLWSGISLIKTDLYLTMIKSLSSPLSGNFLV